MREPVLPALLGGLKGNALPFCLFLGSARRIEAHRSPRRKERKDFGRADLDRFLHDEVHVFTLRDGLGQGNAGAERRAEGLLQNAQLDRSTEGGDLGGGFASMAIEEGHPIALLKSQYTAGVVRLGAGQGGRWPIVRR